VAFMREVLAYYSASSFILVKLDVASITFTYIMAFATSLDSLA
jgi:hypothetical protein